VNGQKDALSPPRGGGDYCLGGGGGGRAKWKISGLTAQLSLNFFIADVNK